ncbi:MAG: hypothetical protein ABIU54_11030 [Candidatus Eisenbacteria bacterium]
MSGVAGMGARPTGPALLWLNPIALASEHLMSPHLPSVVSQAIDAMPETFLSVAGRACLQRDTWYRSPWKTWAMVRCEASGSGTRLRVAYAANPATLFVLLTAGAITFATLPLADAVLYVGTLGGVAAIVGSFARFIARGDVAILHARIVRAAGASTGSNPNQSDVSR